MNQSTRPEVATTRCHGNGAHLGRNSDGPEFHLVLGTESEIATDECAEKQRIVYLIHVSNISEPRKRGENGKTQMICTVRQEGLVRCGHLASYIRYAKNSTGYN